jgi:general secretion pathway protein F/type IV pilus assembly protein PilC
MPEFTYTARAIDGQRVSGTLSATTEREVIHMLSGRSLFPISVAPIKEKKSVTLSGLRVTDQAASNFFASLASLLRGGVPLLRALKILQSQTSNRRLKSVLEDVVARVEDGDTIGDAFARHPKVFNEITVNLARAGAEGGFLEDAFERVAQFIEHRSDLKSRTVGALVYPAILAGVGSVILIVLLVFFIPKFAELFDELRQRGKLPAATDWLLSFSEFLEKYGIFAVLVFAVLLGILWVQIRTPQGRRGLDWLKLRLPMFGAIFRNLAVARFCRVLGTLLKNGVPLLKSLEISREATGNRLLAEAVEQAAENVTSGESLAVPLRKSQQFPVTVTEMISVAEESNTLDTVLVNVADGLEKQTMRRLDLMVRMLEPLMLVVMASIIMVIVVALLLPILKMGEAFA